MLASEADRDATQAVLQQAFAERRLTLEEFESRVERALTARTQGELARLTRDIPTGQAAPIAGPAAPTTGGARAPARPQPGRRRKEEPRDRKFRLLLPEVCPSCGDVLESYYDGKCFRCDIRSISRAAGIPDVVKKVLVSLPMLEHEPAIEQYLTGAPQEHNAILALTSAMADIGPRIRDTHPNEDVRESGLRLLSADDVWMLDLTLDVMHLLARRLPGKSSPWDDDHDRVPERLRSLDEATQARQWKRALRQAADGPVQFRQLRGQVPRRAPSRR